MEEYKRIILEQGSGPPSDKPDTPVTSYTDSLLENFVDGAKNFGDSFAKNAVVSFLIGVLTGAGLIIGFFGSLAILFGLIC